MIPALLLLTTTAPLAPSERSLALLEPRRPPVNELLHSRHNATKPKKHTKHKKHEAVSRHHAIQPKQQAQITIPESRARDFHGAVCQAAITREVAAGWERIEPVCGDGRYSPDRTASMVLAPTSPDVKQMIYVRNAKAASTFLYDELAKGNLLPDLGRFSDHGRADWRTSGETDRSPNEAGNFIWTVVRDPIDTALDAFEEVYRREVEPLGKENPSLNNMDHSLPWFTYTGSNPLARLKLFLGALEARQNLGVQGHHAYPQVLKVGGKAAPFNAIVRLEDGLDSRSAGLPAIGSAAGVAFHVEKPSSEESHSNEHESFTVTRSMALQDPEIARQLCRIYMADYTCFGYELPAICR
jgi:hypothetical protein